MAVGPVSFDFFSAKRYYRGMTTFILLFASISQTLDLPKGLLDSICFIESTYNAKAIHKDDGAENSVGLCQLHLSTARLMGYKGNEKGLLDPKTNTYYAGKYLGYQLKRYQGDPYKAVAAYNAGSFRVNAKGLTKNRKYVSKVLKQWVKTQCQAGTSNTMIPTSKKLSFTPRR